MLDSYRIAPLGEDDLEATARFLGNAATWDRGDDGPAGGEAEQPLAMAPPRTGDEDRDLRCAL